LYSPLHLECHLILICNLNFLGLFSTERGYKRPRELVDDRLRYESEETALQMQYAVHSKVRTNEPLFVRVFLVGIFGVYFLRALKMYISLLYILRSLLQILRSLQKSPTCACVSCGHLVRVSHVCIQYMDVSLVHSEVFFCKIWSFQKSLSCVCVLCAHSCVSLVHSEVFLVSVYLANTLFGYGDFALDCAQQIHRSV